MKTLSERIAEAQAELTRRKDALLESMAQFEETPDDDELLNQVDELTNEVEKATKHLDMLKRAEKAVAEKVVEKGTPEIITSVGKKEDSKDLWLKKAVCAFIAHTNHENPDVVMERLYPNNKALKAVVQFQKSAVPVATTFDAGWAAELVRTDTRGFVDLMTPTSVVAALAGRSMYLEFDGYDSITIPKRAPRVAGQTLGGGFVGEGGVIPLGRVAVGASTLSRYAQKVISTFTAELAERSTPSIEAIIRQAILDDMSIQLDEVFLGSLDQVAGVQPAGIGFNVSPVAGTAGGGVDAVIADIKAAVTAMTSAGLGVRPVLLVNTNDALSVGLMQTALGEFMFRDEMTSNRLLGFEVIRSLNVAAGTMYLVDANALAIAFDPVTFKTTDVATVTEASADTTAPTQADDGAGAIGTAAQVPRNAGIKVAGSAGAASAGYTARSLFQTNSIGIRAIQPVSLGTISAGAVYIADNLTW